MSVKLSRCGSATCTAMLKTLLFFFNVIFFALGGCLVLIGIYGLKDLNMPLRFVSASSVWTVLLCIGMFMVLVAVLSFWCIPKGVSWLLKLYAVIVFMLFVAVVCASSVFIVKRDSLEESIQTGIADLLENYPTKSVSIDLMQSKIHCCGLENYTDWFRTPWANKVNNVPSSCCINMVSCVHMNLNPLNATDIWQEGCFSKVRSVIEDQYTFIGGIGFAGAFLIFFGSVLSWWLARNIKNNQYESMN